jgi:uncharacterized protein (UPF0332 family)
VVGSDTLLGKRGYSTQCVVPHQPYDIAGRARAPEGLRGKTQGVERKACENLSAASTLANLDDPCPNAATTRAYYAAYQAVWSKLEEHDVPVPVVRPGVEYFKHDEIGPLAQEHQLFDRRLAVLFEHLRAARVKADYYLDDCTQDLARTYVQNAKVIVESLLGAGCCDDQ